VKNRTAAGIVAALFAGFVAAWGDAPGVRCSLGAPQAAGPVAATDRAVYVGGGLSDEQAIVLSTAVAAAPRAGLFLLDSLPSRPYLKQFLMANQPARVVPVGSFDEPAAELCRQWSPKTGPVVKWKRGPPGALWEVLYPKAERVVVCPCTPRDRLLQAACLAGVLGAPLFVTHDAPEEPAELRHWLAAWQTRELFAVGDAARLTRDTGGVRTVELPDADAVAAAHRGRLREQGPIRTVVVANPADARLAPLGTSALAPWIACQRRAALLLTNQRGDDAGAVVREALRGGDLSQVDHLLLAADLRAIPTEKRPNPIAGKDAEIEMEPMTPAGAEPFALATGRLFHQDLAVVPLILARQGLLDVVTAGRKALVVSNPGGGLPLLETFSRHTARELQNRGYESTTLFEEEATPAGVRQRVPRSHIFLWEGHHKTLVEEYGLPHWEEPLPGSLVFLQSCLALNEEETRGLLQRGAVGLVGSATRTYSASGGAFTLAFFDAMLYDGQTLGGCLRQAKNFLLCYTLLKEKRLGENARLTGANVRSSWAFTLWGDPTLRLPRPAPPGDALPAVRYSLRGNTLTLHVPDRAYEKVSVGKYTAEMVPNARLAGLLTADGEDTRRLVPFLFAEVPLGTGGGRAPRLSGRLPARNYVTVWDARRGCLYLLAMPRSKDTEELRFRIEWGN
jgi:hypothetical protein